MNFPFYIAKRYLLAKKSHNLINIITGISVIGIGVGAFALIVVLSVFNGFETVIGKMVNSVSPDLLIEPAEGKTFDREAFPFELFEKNVSVAAIIEVVEEDALFRYDEKQHIGRIKGVSNGYQQQGVLDSLVADGFFAVEKDGIPFAMIGVGVAWHLGINLRNVSDLLQVYVPQRGNPSGFSLDQGFANQAISVAGTFASQQDYDSKYVIVSIDWAKELLGYTNELNAVELFVKKGNSVSKLQSDAAQKLGNAFIVKDKYQQQETLFRIMRTEKWAIFIILTFILIMATFNVIGSLTMLIIDKKKDTVILRQLGTSQPVLQRLFLTEGLLISTLGGIIGLAAGVILVLIQQKFGILQLGSGSGSFVIDAYPVKLLLTDVLAVFITVIVIGGLSSVYTVRQSLPKVQ